MGVYSEKSTSRGAGFDNSDVAYSAIGMENVIEANVNRFDYLSLLKHQSEGFHGEEAAVTETGHVCEGRERGYLILTLPSSSNSPVRFGLSLWPQLPPCSLILLLPSLSLT